MHHARHRKHPRLILSLGFLSTVLAFAELRADSIPGLFNTGCDNAGHALPTGTAELHYTLAGPTSDPRVTVPGGSTVSAPSGSAWISPTPSSVGLFTYTLHFDLTGLDSTTAVITGQSASDKAFAPILLNGIDTGYKTERLTLASFTITNGFTAGLNTLQFVVTNSADASGLVVSLTGTAFPLPVHASILRSGASVTVCWQSESNRPYMVDYRPDVAAGNWTLLSGGITGDGSKICVPDSLAAGIAQRFYRVVSLPKP